MIESFKQMSLNVIVDFGKHKKPSKLTMLIGKLLQQMLDAYRQSSFHSYETYD